MQTPWTLSVTMVEHTTSLYASLWHGSMSARCSYCTSMSASRQTFCREQNEEHSPPSLPQLTTPATPAVKAALSPAPCNSLECHLIPLVPAYFQTSLSSMPHCTSKQYTSLPPNTKEHFWQKNPVPWGTGRWRSTGI